MGLDASRSARPKLHEQITSELARQVIRAQRERKPVAFPNEAELCGQLGVSRSILRESMKVLVDKGMIEMRPRTGTRARPKSDWRLLDPDILAWQAELEPDRQFLRDLCEVRLAIEPTASGFAAIRATAAEFDEIGGQLARRRSLAQHGPMDQIIDADLAFYAAVVAASHNPLLEYLSTAIRQPFRTALLYTSRRPANIALGLEVHFKLLDALRARDPIGARNAAEEAIGLAMVAVEAGTRRKVVKYDGRIASPARR